MVEQIPVAIGDDQDAEIARVADRIRRRQPMIAADRPCGPAVAAGWGPGPSLFLHDTAGIQPVGPRQPSGLEYRPLPLARDGDFLAISREWNPAFESYCREFLRLGAVEVLRARPSHGRATLATLCRRDADVRRRLADAARTHGGLTLHPYISSAAVWRLAAAIAADAGVPVVVAAPPPRLARCVNDKLWFAARVAELLGPDALPPTRRARDTAALIRHVTDLLPACDTIVMKLPSAAGSTGNCILDCARLRGRPHDTLRAELVSRFRQLGWRRPFPLLVSVWETPVAMSPSVQLWIPAAGHGPPIVEGIFEQHVAGEAGRFTGASPAGLPAATERRIAAEAAVLATLFQHLGYFGRCSFDAILVGDDPGRAALHWVECNGRWGGTSIPMTTVNRLTGNWASAPFATVHPDWPLRISFDEVLDRTRDRLFRPADPAGLLFVSPGDPAALTGIEWVAIDRDVRTARRQAQLASALLRA
ncbi:MAG TPA: hypothetical protein VF158_12820 [Longimicrobiales bacterium]